MQIICTTCEKKYSNSKTKKKKKIKIRRNGFLDKLSDSKLAKFSQIGTRAAVLEFKAYPQLALIFISRKQLKKIFGGVLPVTRLFINYSPKAKLILLNNPRYEVEEIIQQC